ncbi:carboxypeptidase regulatory-like domain-containing protein [Myxococcus sp. AS-1-15]|uniref:carboxypeptidase regulatory-like domain-containing protein n=1 Tax=Myxococcus sp. AS-1-15 TaxID=2874600 RepID=UPI001CBE0865|nr:carboxypeptidase regulatory-like domain-containing protein [Myxococcus sp. AS-1-15]MBZ4397353.1 carboxypeptidase regulatory-like domain-containing protein [Myxococcus sp. AS-1-15]
MSRKTVFAVAIGLALVGVLFIWRAASTEGGDASIPAASDSASRGESAKAKPASPSTPRGTVAQAPATGTPPVAEAMREEEGTVQVEVHGSSRPVEGAQVSLYVQGPRSPETGRPTWFVAGRGTTDATGTLRLPARPGPYLVTAKARGFAAARLSLTRPRGEALTPVRLTLGEGVTLSGSVVERASKAPVPLARLTLTPRTVLASASVATTSVPEEERHEASADERGLFRCEGLTPGEYQLEVTAPAHSTRRIARVQAPASGLVVELDGSAFIEGFVELPEGKPAAGARVTATGMGETFETETSAGGGFSLDVPPGVYQVSARLDALTGTARERAVVGAGMTLRDVRIRLGAAASLTGIVRGKGTSVPIAGATVSIAPGTMVATFDAAPAEVASATSGTDGRFDAGNLAPGSYSVTVRAKGFRVLRREGITVLAGQRFEMLAELDANGRIEGTVVDDSDQPLAGIQVTPERRWRMMPMEGVLTSVTDAQGAFVLEDVPPGDVFVAARRPGSQLHVRERVAVSPGQTHQVKLKLGGEGTLEGTVKLADGRVPTAAVTVFAQLADTARTEAHQIPTAADGTWSMRVRAGRYRVAAWLVDVGNQNSDQEKVVDLKAGATERVDLQVREAERPLSVTVLEPNGAPSVSATVMGAEAGKNEIFLEDSTDASGQVTLVADSLGTQPLHIWATNGGRRGDLPSVPATQRSLVIQLQPGGRLTGAVRSAGGRSIEGFRLVVSATKSEDDFLSRQELELAGDRFVVEDVNPGAVTVSVTLPDGRAGKADTMSVAGQTTQVDVVVEAGGAISGRLVDKAGKPLAQAFVDVDGLTSAPTGADGRFRVEDVAPGQHRLIAWSEKTERAEKKLTLAVGKSQDVGDWKLGPPRIEPGRLGIFFGMAGDDVLVRGVLESMHGDALRVGDIVQSIDGATVLTAGEARERELGAPGSPAILIIRRDTRTYPVTLSRAP